MIGVIVIELHSEVPCLSFPDRNAFRGLCVCHCCLLDEIDKSILSQLCKNARTSGYQIASALHDMGYQMTDRAVRQRLSRLENKGVILGYSVLLNPNLVSEKISRTVLLKFKFTGTSLELIQRLNTYCHEAPFCLYSSRLSGDFDWIGHFVFDSLEQYELESNNFLHRFAELIADYRSYESKTWKISPYSILDEHEMTERKAKVYRIIKSIEKDEEKLRDKLQMIVESLVKFFDAKFARIWLMDKERKYLILKFSAGKYRNTQGEFSKVPMDSLKIGAIAKTGKPIITNDVVHDSRIKYPDWAKKEKLRSFAGYPLTYEHKIVGVMAMFSEKQLLPADFELLGIFCDKVSKELSAAFDAQEYLAIK